MEFKFERALPVWSPENKNEWNQFVGFTTALDLKKPTTIKINLTARSYYRLYINGEMEAHGPARTAHGHLRVDELTFNLRGKVSIAVEVASYSKPDRYSNTIPLEPGLFIAEIWDDQGIISATGSDWGTPWFCTYLDYRREKVEMLSHSREIMEVYDLSPDWLDWSRSGGLKVNPVVIGHNIPVFNNRRAPYADYAMKYCTQMLSAGDVIAGETDDAMLGLLKFMQPTWYGSLNEFIVPEIKSQKAGGLSGKLTDGPVVRLENDHDCYLLWDLGEAVTGFTVLKLTVEKDCIVDVLNADRLGDDGQTAEEMVIRYHLKAGTYDLTSYEPYFFRYLKVVLRGAGRAEIHHAGAMTYWYPDRKRGSFACSDGQLNAIYEAARRTLQANTMDIFMDCPQRERGGWLCDSLWSGRAARMLFGDLSVEEDFIENFIFTDPDFYKNAIFPEVYPGNSRNDSGDPGIVNWSFWLVLEICEYYKRSANKEHMMLWLPRIERFVEGTQQLIGESGLLENLSGIFVDWSQANNPSNTQPISIPVNCLYAYMLECLAEAYDNAKWKALSDRQWAILKEVPGAMVFGPSGSFPANYADSLTFKDGVFTPGAMLSEAAMFTDVWCGLADKTGNDGFKRSVIMTMGTCPPETANVMIGIADLFIGLTIRYDILSKAGRIDMLMKELKDVYLEQIAMGPGTLFENATGYASRCHGFNGHAGVLLMRDVLGLNEPDALNKTIRIAPHLCGLKWASGKTACGDGEVMVSWQADAYKKTFVLNVYSPEDYQTDIVLPDEVRGWDACVNQK